MESFSGWVNFVGIILITFVVAGALLLNRPEPGSVEKLYDHDDDDLDVTH